ncbi:polymer-forming cytoskeletal protein [Paenibacillus sp. D51F]
MFKENKRWSASDTLIGQGTRAEGTLSCQASLRIEGEYRGDIDCKEDVIVGESGVVRSNISAKDITISGKVYGDVTTTGRLTIMSSGQLHGSAAVASLIVQDGGILSGSCRMEQRAPEQAQHQSEQQVQQQSSHQTQPHANQQAQQQPARPMAADGVRETRDAVRDGTVKERRQAG